MYQLSVASVIAALLTSLFVVPSSYAAIPKDAARCLRVVGAAGQKYAKLTSRARAKCQDAVSAGKLAPATDCVTEPKSERRLDKAAEKLGRKIAKKCDDADVSSLRFAGDCGGVTTTAALETCLRSSHDRETDDLLATLYATDDELVQDARRCQAQVSKQALAFANTRLRLLRRCRDRAGKDAIEPGMLCRDEPRTAVKLARKRVRASDRIDARCDDGALAAVDFGSPCRAPAHAAELAACVLAVAEGASDTQSTVAYGDGGFCGDAHQGVEGRVEALLAEMTLEEKAEQMHGSSFLPVDGLWPTADNDRLGIPGFAMIDGPRGVSQIAGNATAFPVGIARGASWDVDLEERIGAAMGTEARAKGASVLLAPVTTVIRHPRWGRCQETYGEDPFHIGRLGVAFVRGAQRHVIASAKHYALNSIEDTRFTVSVSADERTLHEIYLPHFRAVVEDGDVASVMSAYNRVDGLYCAENPTLLGDILKGDWDFRGFVESDWYLGTRSTVGSALAGLDIEMPRAQFYGAALVDEVDGGAVPESVIDDSVRRILRTKLCFRLDTDPPVANPAVVESAEHVALALEAAHNGIVLLENDGPTLPLDRGLISTLAVVGPLADAENIGDSGSSNVTPSEIVTVLEGLEDRAGGVTIVHVTDPGSAGGQSDLAAADAVVVVAGFTAADEGEGVVGAGDRETYKLPAEQEQLIADVATLNDATIVVLEGGSAIGVEAWADDVEAILMAWYPGMQGGNAVADILFGDVNPSGKLPLVVAASESDLPPFINDQDEVTYDYYHGYRLLDRDDADPRYAFGHGLSYTTYAYANLAVEEATLEATDRLRVAFDVTNTGPVAGEEIVQLYVSYDGSAVDRPELELKAFARVALDPAETERMTLELPVEDLGYYDDVTGQWQVEAVTHGVHVGRSSRDLPLSAIFDVVP